MIVEGATETAFLPVLNRFLQSKLPTRMPQLKGRQRDGRIPTGMKLQKLVETLLSGRDAFDHVIALTDVYTGQRNFKDASDAKLQMRNWVGPEPRFHPHAAQYDFEAWLIPYWPKIQQRAKHNLARPGNNPETVNHDRPPSYRIKEIFERGKISRSYSKTIDAKAILDGSDLSIAIDECAELRDLVNTILRICGAQAL
jgi:hypothetical protein